MTQAPKYSSPWLALESLPEPPRTTRFLLEPLQEKHAELDYEALMSCRARLRKELQWNGWPPEEFTLEENRDDLREHHAELERREAFAYTVLRPGREQCLGCVYLERCAEIQAAQLAFWVIDEAIELEAALVASVLDWVHQTWNMRRVVIPLRETNSRGIALVQQCGLTEWDGPPIDSLRGHCCFLSQAGNS